ncbi:MAG: hypothetical protein H6811_05255 [Phycisphaeraceae bacterium]|nr:hypothetical protein [Phycisphaeraceae bacterium]
MTQRSVCVVLAAGLCANGAMGIDEAHRDRAREMCFRAIEFLRAQQDASGGWAHNPQGPNLPAISGLVVTGMLLDDSIDPSDPDVADGLRYILTFRQADGGIYDTILASYNTSICLSALAIATREAEGGAARVAIGPAQEFLYSLQYSEDALVSGEASRETKRVDRDHPFYGGIGYGSGGRPDNSNLNFMLQALQDSGVASDHPSVQRALVFLQRTQMLDESNDLAYADGSHQGGFIYSTSPNGEHAGEGESKAGTIEETLDDGTRVSRLRAYGSMTYAGFKSYLYADLKPSDPRVSAAYDWIRRNYTLAENPGMGSDGQYYYYVTFARALDALSRASGNDAIGVIGPDGSQAERDWANDLVDQLATMQNADGSFRSVDSRWMEDNPVLITAYSLIALQHAAH